LKLKGDEMTKLRRSLKSGKIDRGDLEKTMWTSKPTMKLSAPKRGHFPRVTLLGEKNEN